MGIRHVWRDGKSRKNEDLFNDFVTGLVRAAEYEKARRAERERRHQAWLEEERRRQERERQRLEEETRIKGLEQEVARWFKAQQIRAYLAAFEKAWVERQGPIEPGSRAGEWVT